MPRSAPLNPVRGGHRHLVHAHHDPVGVVVITRLSEHALEKPLLGALAVAADVRVAAVLVTHVIVIERNDAH
jgi:hypothetical protein